PLSGAHRSRGAVLVFHSGFDAGHVAVDAALGSLCQIPDAAIGGLGPKALDIVGFLTPRQPLVPALLLAGWLQTAKLHLARDAAFGLGFGLLRRCRPVACPPQLFFPAISRLLEFSRRWHLRRLVVGGAPASAGLCEKIFDAGSGSS